MPCQDKKNRYFRVQDNSDKIRTRVANSPQRRVVWMWFGALPGAFGLGRAQPQRRGIKATSTWEESYTRWFLHYKEMEYVSFLLL